MMKEQIVAQEEKGFSLIEVAASMLVLLILMSAVFTILGKYQVRYQGEQQGADVHQSLRSTMELLGQEIGQAGYLGFTTRNLTAAVAVGTNPASVDSVDGIYAGQRLLVGAGATEEQVTVASVAGNSFTATFGRAHPFPPGAPVTVLGTCREGILLSSTATRLQLFGDVNGDGILVLVDYNITGGILSRSVKPVTGPNQSGELLRDLQPNPGNTPVFQYRPTLSGGVNYITEVWVTLTTRSATRDPETNAFRTMTSSSIFSPRSVIAAIDLANSGSATRVFDAPVLIKTLAAQ
jgi:prepilin-type N-terminal cleavage/methylation domain-containing protein